MDKSELNLTNAPKKFENGATAQLGLACTVAVDAAGAGLEDFVVQGMKMTAC